jgi:predicted amidohydrolase
MDSIIVATAQQQMRLFESAEDHRRELARFMQAAQVKGAQLVVFPALSGVLSVSPLLEGFRVSLLKRAARSRRQTSAWERTRRALAGSTADLLRANFRRPYMDLLATDPRAAIGASETLYADLARTYEMTVVAGSAYLPGFDGTLQHRIQVYGPDGMLLGQHAKVLLAPEEADWVTPGDEWAVIETPVARVGLAFGEEILYPEVGRLLAQQDAGLLIVLAATSDEVTLAELRQALAARATENRCFVVSSFPVGTDYLSQQNDTAAPALLGKSGIYAPAELTPRFSGVLVEMGASTTEGLLTAELNVPLLSDLRQRRPLQIERLLPLLTLPAASLPPPGETLLLTPLDDSEVQDSDV